MNPRLATLYDHSPAALQSLYISWYGYRIRRQRFNREHDRWMELFDRSQWWSEEEMGAYQDQRLAALVAHCYESIPFYRRLMEERRLRPADVRRRSDLMKLPILTKFATRFAEERMQ